MNILSAIFIAIILVGKFRDVLRLMRDAGIWYDLGPSIFGLSILVLLAYHVVWIFKVVG